MLSKNGPSSQKKIDSSKTKDIFLDFSSATIEWGELGALPANLQFR